MNPLVILDERRVQQLLVDPAARAAVPPLAEAALKYQASGPKGGCTPCQQRRLKLEADRAGKVLYTLANVKTVIGTLGKEHVSALKRVLKAKRYRVTFVSPGGRMITLTV